MKTTFIGKRAESRVADFLKNKGFKILAQNWRTKVCEIDVIAQKDKVAYFVEVKYRSSEKQGDGLEYITPKKTKAAALCRPDLGAAKQLGRRLPHLSRSRE